MFDVKQSFVSKSIKMGLSAVCEHLSHFICWPETFGEWEMTKETFNYCQARKRDRRILELSYKTFCTGFDVLKFLL